MFDSIFDGISPVPLFFATSLYSGQKSSVFVSEALFQFVKIAKIAVLV